MPQCRVCASDQRRAIEGAMLAGQSIRTVAEQFGMSATGVWRHRQHHLPAALLRARDTADVAQADSLLADLQALRLRAARLLDRAERLGDIHGAVAAIREARSLVELLSRTMARAQPQPPPLADSDEWHAVRAAIEDALSGYPAAQAAVAARLRGLTVTNTVTDGAGHE